MTFIRMQKAEEAGHTPLPWAVEYDVEAQGVNHLAITARHAGKEWMPASITPMDYMRPVDEANARFICKAVNCHDELVEALEELQKQIRAHHPMNVKKDYSLMVADAAANKALAKAKGEA